jgi:nucleoside-diphosphate-sugar epimerase
MQPLNAKAPMLRVRPARALRRELRSQREGDQGKDNEPTRMNVVGVENLCEAIHRCATLDPARVNDTFNVGANKFETMGEHFQTVLDRASHGKHVVGLPVQPVIWTLKLLELLHLSPIYK